MGSQRIAAFGAGTSLTLVRVVDRLSGQASRMWWADGQPCCLVRSRFDAAELVLAAHHGPARRPGASCRGARLMGMAASPTGDGLVVLHEHPQGARIFTTRIFTTRNSTTRNSTTHGGELVGERVFPAEHLDRQIASDGRTIVLAGPRGAAPWCFADWSLGEPRTWSLDPLCDALGEPCGPVTGLHDLGDGPLLVTPTSWSRWRWDGTLQAAWPAPRDRGQPSLVAWHDAAPILFGPGLDERGQPQIFRGGYELFVWDRASGQARSLGQALDWPRGACSPDGRWLVVDRVTRRGRGLELWDLPALRQVERLDTRRRAVQAIAFAPDGRDVAIATMEDLFVLRVVA